MSAPLVVLVVALVLLAGLLSAGDAALSSFSRARAEELVREERPGARRLLAVVEDPPRVLSTLLFLRLLCEITAIVLATVMTFDAFGASSREVVAGQAWRTVLVTVAIMLVVSFVAIGVGPRTVGRQHSERIARWSAAPLLALTKVLGPFPRLLILLGNALTPGRGFSEGPFASEAELRELVDMAEASSLIETGESKMIHSVFELGDTIVREVMVPRTDLVYIEGGKTLRQAESLLLRSGYSRLPVVGDDLDEVLGFIYLKDIARRVFDHQGAGTSEQVSSAMRPALHVPDTKPCDDLLREMQSHRRHIAVVVDEYGGTAGLVTIEDVLEEIVGEITDEFDTAQEGVEPLPGGVVRVPSRYPVDDLEELFEGKGIEDDEVDSIGGLMAKHLGLVPIPGSTVEVGGLRFTAESTAGRRKRIGTVTIVPVAVDVKDPESA